MQRLRLQRVNELLKRQLGEIIRRELPISEAGVITVNEVNVSNDLHYATVFVGVVGNDKQQKRAVEMLDTERKRLQGLVGKSVILKYTPQLKFILDESISRGNRVLEILNEIERTSEPNEGAPKDH